jgi:hypothetical protein
VSPLTAYPYTEITNDGTLGQIVDPNINDVAMTVLPNAPIDSATGLPVPTIAVATNGGVSVIKDDGTVINRGGSSYIRSIEFDGTTHYIYGSAYNSGGHASSYRRASINATGSTGDLYSTADAYLANTYWVVNRPDTGHDEVDALRGSYLADANDIAKQSGDAVGSVLGLTRVLDTTKEGLLTTSYITSSYNTGWMNGDIKLATLSDTDDTDVTGTELVTNGTFNTDTSGWTVDGVTATVSSGQVTMTGSGDLTQAISLVSGKKYVISADVVSITDCTANLKINTDSTGSGGTVVENRVNAGSLSGTFTASSSSIYIAIQNGSAGGSASSTWDNVSVRLAEPDRSVNGNGLQVFGTVTKTPVATGADLVAYSGFSNSTNYLKQPYNSDLEIGSGDISFSVWIYPTAYTGYPYVFARGNNLFFYLYVDGNIRVKMGSTLYSSTVVPTNTWSCVTVVKRSGVITIYLNGNESESGASTDDITAVDTPLYVGVAYDGLNNFLGKISLLRISATAPSAEQIKKIYEDEKVLFQENAQATLYGSSDAVTALAYDDDTELLHVGTSAGRSVFQGLRRVDNTTDAVGAAISASGGMVADD